MTTLRISITAEVLEATKDCKDWNAYTNCAISYAIREIWPKAITDYEIIYPFGSMFKPIIEHTEKYFIKRFDRATPAERAAMQPFSFEIEVPDEVIGEVNIEEIRRICEGSRTLELV